MKKALLVLALLFLLMGCVEVRITKDDCDFIHAPKLVKAPALIPQTPEEEKLQKALREYEKNLSFLVEEVSALKKTCKEEPLTLPIQEEKVREALENWAESAKSLVFYSVLALERIRRDLKDAGADRAPGEEAFELYANVESVLSELKRFGEFSPSLKISKTLTEAIGELEGIITGITDFKPRKERTLSLRQTLIKLLALWLYPPTVVYGNVVEILKKHPEEKINKFTEKMFEIVELIESLRERTDEEIKASQESSSELLKLVEQEKKNTKALVEELLSFGWKKRTEELVSKYSTLARQLSAERFLIKAGVRPIERVWKLKRLLGAFQALEEELEKYLTDLRREYAECERIAKLQGLEPDPALCDLIRSGSYWNYKECLAKLRKLAENAARDGIIISYDFPDSLERCGAEYRRLLEELKKSKLVELIEQLYRDVRDKISVLRLLGLNIDSAVADYFVFGRLDIEKAVGNLRDILDTLEEEREKLDFVLRQKIAEYVSDNIILYANAEEVKICFFNPLGLKLQRGKYTKRETHDFELETEHFELIPGRIIFTYDGWEGCEGIRFRAPLEAVYLADKNNVLDLHNSSVEDSEFGKFIIDAEETKETVVNTPEEDSLEVLRRIAEKEIERLNEVADANVVAKYQKLISRAGSPEDLEKVISEIRDLRETILLRRSGERAVENPSLKEILVIVIFGMCLLLYYRVKIKKVKKKKRILPPL